MSEQLCLILSDVDLSWGLVDLGTKKVGKRGRVEFNGKVDRLREEISAFPELQQLHDTVSLAYAGSQTTLCPADLRSELGTRRLAQLNFGTKEDADYNLLMELGMCNVFTFPEHLKRFSVTKFPSANHFHLGTVMIKGILKGSPFFPKLHLAPFGENGLLVAFTDRNKVAVYNTFVSESDQDVIYYGLNVLSGVEYDRRDAKVCFYGDWSGRDTQQIAEKLMGSGLQKVEEPDFLITSQLHCV